MFNAGDRVRIKPECSYIGRISHSDVGTVQGVEVTGSYFIRWDHYDGWKHDNGRRCDDGHGWIVNEAYLTLVPPDDLGEFVPESKDIIDSFLMRW